MTISEPLHRVRRAKRMLLLAWLVTIALCGASLFYLGLADYRMGGFLAVMTVILGTATVLPARAAYRAQWKRQSLLAGYGKYAEQTELDENPHMAPEQVELLCLFPFDMNAVSDFDVSREVRLVCRERGLRITELSIPARIRGLEAVVDGCLIQMTMPRAPVSRMMLTGEAFGSYDILTAWYRKNLRLLPAMYSVQAHMLAFGDGSEPSPRTLDQLDRITARRSRDIVLCLSGRELSIFIRNAKVLRRPPHALARITQQRLERLGIPEVPAILDFAFDTEALRAGADAPYDETEERKQAGLRMTDEQSDDPFRRPEEAP